MVVVRIAGYTARQRIGKEAVTMSTQKESKRPGARVSPTAPDTKSLSASVWRFLENDAPGFNEAMEEGTAQIAAGKSTRLSAARAKKDRGRG